MLTVHDEKQHAIPSTPQYAFFFKVRVVYTILGRVVVRHKAHFIGCEHNTLLHENRVAVLSRQCQRCRPRVSYRGYAYRVVFVMPNLFHWRHIILTGNSLLMIARNSTLKRIN